MPTGRGLPQAETDHDRMRCVIDAQGNLVFASPAVGWSVGFSGDTLIGKPAATILKIVSSRDSNHQSLSLSDIQSGFYEVALLRRERDPLLVQARVDIVEAPNGRKYIVVWLDLDNKLKRQRSNDFHKEARDFTSFVVDTQTKKAVETSAAVPAEYISNADGELRHFLNLTSDLMGVYHRDGSFGRVNATFNRALGYTDAELKTFPFIDLIIPEDRELVQAAMQKILQSPQDQEARADFEARTRCKDGGVRWIQWAHKTAGEYIYVVGRDMADVKQKETELQRREAQLFEAQKIGRMGHWYWEVGQQAMEWSGQIYSIFGVEKGAFAPAIENVKTLVLKRDLGRTLRSFQRAVVRKKDYELQFRLRRPEGGGVRFIHCEGRCKIDPKTGEVEALFGIMQDITERTLHERALQEAKDAAESAYASKTRFLANMSHELRTPLNAIIGFSEMMQSQLLGPVNNSRYLGYIGDIQRAGRHLLDLINDILDMSKIEIGKYELHAEEVNVGKLFSLALNMVEGHAHDAQVRLISDGLPMDLQIMADRRALMQVLLNLLSNAIKFTKAGGAVEVKCQRELGGVALIVSDTGVGIPQDKIKIVTLPFEQVDSELTRSHEGSGLGLAITKDLVELHGGTLEIDSEVGVGTTVTVLLPEKLPETKPVKSAAAERTAEMAG